MKTEKWIQQINKTTEDFCEAFAGLSEEGMNWKPEPHTWSIAQNMEHLIVINESYFSILDSLEKGTYKTPFLGKFGFLTHLVGKALVKAVQPDRKKKTKTFKLWEPTEGAVLSGMVERFSEHQEELKRRIEGSEELLKKGTVISSPANRNIVYKLEAAFEILVLHERRHLEQAKEVLQRLPGKNREL